MGTWGLYWGVVRTVTVEVGVTMVRVTVKCGHDGEVWA